MIRFGISVTAVIFGALLLLIFLTMKMMNGELLNNLSKFGGLYEKRRSPFTARSTQCRNEKY